MANCLERIWNNWKNNEMQCKSCPNNDVNNYWYPFYGMGDKNSDIMILGDTPAYNLENIQFRNQKDAQQLHEPIANSHQEAARIFLENRKQSNSNQLKKVIEAFFKDTQYTIDSVYFTNTKKCGDISDKHKTGNAINFNNLNGYGYCKSYLDEEITYIKPKLIIVLGGKAWKHLRELLHLPHEDSITRAQYKLIDHKIDESNKTIILPLMHWGYYRRNNQLSEYLNKTNRIIQKIINHDKFKNLQNNS